MITTILDWEIKYDLFNRGKLHGFDFYPYMRRELINTCLNKINGVSVDPFAAKGQEDTGFKLFLKLLKKSESTDIRKADLLILCHSRRNLTVNANGENVYESVFTDFLEEDFPNSVTLERQFTNHSHFEPPMTKNICYTDRIVLKSYLYRLFFRYINPAGYKGLYDEVYGIMAEALKDLALLLSIELKIKPYCERAVILYYYYRSRKKDYIRFLKKTEPKLVAEVVGKSFDAMLINETCREMGIKTVELQHCLLGVTAKYPKGINEKQFADYYLTYSEYWKDYAEYPIPDGHVIPAGSPYFERQVLKYKGKSEKKGIPVVMFISGMAYGRELSAVAVELKKLAGDGVEIIYKLHPDEFKTWRMLYPELTENGINVIDSKDISIYEFFDRCDIQVGVFSTAIYEGMAFDIKTCILDIPFAREFIDFCKKGHGTLIRDGRDLYEAIRNIKAEKTVSNDGVTEYFWKSGARENIVNVLKGLIGQKKSD